MRVNRTSKIVSLCLWVLPVVFAVPAAAQDDPLTTTLPDGSGTLVLETVAEDSARLRLAHGASVAVPLPQRARVSSLAAVDEGWLVAGSFLAADGSRRLFLRRGAGEGGGAAELPAPDRKSLSPIRRSPTLLVDHGALAGIAWLEGMGERSLTVRAAAWTGEGFAAPEPVSTAGPGTQTALTGTVLADGSWMLIWTAFDGRDDEVVWSRRLGDSWLPVQTLGAPNAVPDIVPAVTVSGTGALAAWSRFDGQGYRLVGARFDGDGWTELPWTGPPGSLYPSFHPGADGPRLLYATARPRGWSVLHLSDKGGELHRASITGDGPRPVLRTEGETP